jgi:hypothetical protein
VDSKEFFRQCSELDENQPGPIPVMVYHDGELYEVERLIDGGSEDPNVQPMIIIVVK